MRISAEAGHLVRADAQPDGGGQKGSDRISQLAKHGHPGSGTQSAKSWRPARAGSTQEAVSRVRPDKLGAVADELADLIAQFPAAIWAQRGEIQPGGIRP